jgi:membrane glycosyltransferase
MNELIKNNIFRFFSFFSFLNLIMLYGSSLYLNYIGIKNLYGIHLYSFIFYIVSLFNISFGFTTILFGFISKLFSKQTNNSNFLNRKPNSKTAILFPIYNEDTSSVFSRVKVIYKFLNKYKLLNNIYIHILSDSNDLTIILKEELAFRELETEFGRNSNLNYRRRINNINYKSGNISDFCKHLGSNYDFMCIMDADSFLNVLTLEKIIIEMETDERLGLIQTYPQVIFPKTMNQIFSYIHSVFSAELYVRGSEFWNRGMGPYWGHNSIVRINAFMNYCLLPKLPKIGPLGEKILSHDTIEASLLRQAGYRTKFIFIENSSFEESPPTLIDSLKRDYRWCQGNLQHFWFIFVSRFGNINRIYILLGILSYIAYFFWFLFLISTLTAYIFDKESIVYTTRDLSSNRLNELIIFIIIILFLPRLISLINYLIYSRMIRLNLIFYYFIDTFLVVFSSSIYLVLISYFIFSTLIGKRIKWSNQRRKLSLQNISVHSYFYYLTLFGIVLLFLLNKFTYHLLIYFSPIFIGLIFAVPISKLYDFTPNFKSNSTNYKSKEINLLNLYLKKDCFSYPELDNNDPLYLLLNDPKLFYTHTSFLRRKKSPIDMSKTIIGKIINNPYQIKNRSTQFIIFNNIFLIEYLRDNISLEIKELIWNDENYNLYVKTILYKNYLKSIIFIKK